MSDESQHLTRRDFVRFAAASAGVVATGSLIASCEREITEPLASGSDPLFARDPGTTRWPLRIPLTLAPAALSLAAAPGTADLGDGRQSSVLAYDYGGSDYFPGPTLVANRGSFANVQLTNGLSEPTTVHWHGMIVPTSADGHPKDAIAPGGGYAYQFSIDQRACLNWYHPHPHMLTGKQVCLGLAGAFIVRDADDTGEAGNTLGLPFGAYEVPLIIRDANVDRSGNLQYNPKSSGFLGNLPLVNGTRNPFLDVAKGAYRFRMLNGANARNFRLAMGDGRPFTLIGNDGGLLPAAVQLSELNIGPGERMDVIVDFSNTSAPNRVMLRDLDARWDVLEFRATGQPQGTGAGSVPSGLLSSIVLLTNPVRTRTFSFDGMSRINGREYSLNRIDFEVPFGDTERWVFTTGGNAPHPVHVHGASFQVQSRSGGRGRAFPWEAGWKDTVLLEDGETVDVLIRFDKFQGEYLLHCHKLEHEDHGMMSNFVVA